MKRQDGGPAFPGKQQALVAPVELGPQVHAIVIDQNGMALRDYFAAHAPVDLIEARNHWYRQNGNGSRQPTIEDLFDILAMLRGMYAAAMLAERAQ